MEDADFSDQFCRFIQTAIPGVDAAELLLMFHREPGVWLTAEEAVGRLGPGATIPDVAKNLERFEAHGLLRSVEGRYQYLADAELTTHVETLAQAYARRPVTLIRVIYALRDSKIKSFAEAFKLRKN